MKRLDEIEARANAATEGPWEADGSAHVLTADNTPAFVARCADPDGSDAGVPDAAFIAHARTDVPALVSVVRFALSQHAPDGYGNCGPCDDATGEDGWPCSTVREIHRLLGEDT